MSNVKCGACGVELEKDAAELCWWCTGPLCARCWDETGHCGHKEADEINERMRAINAKESAPLTDDDLLAACEGIRELGELPAKGHALAVAPWFMERLRKSLPERPHPSKLVFQDPALGALPVYEVAKGVDSYEFAPEEEVRKWAKNGERSRWRAVWAE